MYVCQKVFLPNGACRKVLPNGALEKAPYKGGVGLGQVSYENLFTIHRNKARFVEMKQVAFYQVDIPIVVIRPRLRGSQNKIECEYKFGHKCSFLPEGRSVEVAPNLYFLYYIMGQAGVSIDENLIKY